MSPDRADVVLRVRGRGVRRFRPDTELWISRQGQQSPQRMKISGVSAGDFIGVQYGGHWSNAPVLLPEFPVRRLYGSEKAIHVPTELTPELAFLLGAYLSEGHTTQSNWSVIITNSVIEVLERVQEAWASIFGLTARITRQPGKCMGVVVSSKRLVEYLQLLGSGTRAANKSVPDVVMSARQADVLAFLQGAALDAYTTQASSPKWAICLASATAINQLQDQVTRLGVVNAQIPKHNKQIGKTYFELYAPGASGQEMCRLVPFLEPDKAARATLYLSQTYGGGTSDVIPGLEGRDLYDMVPRGRSGRSGRGTGRQALTHLCDKRTLRVTRASVVRALAAGAVLPTWLLEILHREVRFAKVLDRLN